MVPVLVIIALLIAVAVFYATRTTNTDSVLEASGVLEAETVTVASEIAAKVSTIDVEEGDRVARGDVLASLESRALEARVRQARAARRIAEINLAIASKSARSEQLRQARAAMDQAAAQRSAALRAYALAREMYGVRAAEAPAYTQAKGQVDVLTRQRNLLEDAYAKAGSVPSSLFAYQAKYQRDQADAAYEQALALATETSQAVAAYRSYLDSLVPDYLVKVGSTYAPASHDPAYLSVAQEALAGYNELLSRQKEAESALDRAEATREAAEAAYASALAVSEATSQKELRALEQQLEGVEAQLEAAQSAYETARTLYERGFQERNLMNQALAQADVAGAAYDAARAQYDMLKAGATAEQREIAAAQLEQASAALEEAQSYLDKATVLAPIEGIVQDVFFNPGESVLPGSPLFRIVNLKKMYLTVYMEEPYLGRISVGQSVSISVDSYPNRTFRGRIARISTEAEFTPTGVQTKEERTTTVYAVKIRVDNDRGLLKSGMPADATIRLAR
jgi:HlyD family secretion protein